MILRILLVHKAIWAARLARIPTRSCPGKVAVSLWLRKAAPCTLDSYESRYMHARVALTMGPQNYLVCVWDHTLQGWKKALDV